MRISFILASLWLSGGERIIVEYANRLSRRGHAVSLVLPASTLDPSMAVDVDPAVKIIQTKTSGARKMSILAQLRLSVALALAVPRSDILLTTFAPTTPSGWIASRILRRGRTIWLYMDFAEAFETKPLYRFIARRAANWHDGVVTISSYLKDELVSFGAKVPISVVSLALSQSEVYQPLPQPEIETFTGGKRAILYVGDTRPRKGLADFLQAAKIILSRIPQVEIWISLKDRSDFEAGIPVRFFHRPSHEELRRLYASCAVYVSSTWREGFGLPPLEAMACGAAVVMTDSGGSRDYAMHEINCLLVEARKPEELAEAISRVLIDEETAGRLRTNGPLTAAEFTWDRVIDQLEGVLFLACKQT